MKKVIFISVFIFIVGKLAAQQELALHFMHDIQQVNLTNPAIFPEENINFALPFPIPSTAVNVANTGFTFRDLIHERVQDDSLIIDIDRTLAAMRDDNFIYSHFNFDLVAIGFRVKPLYFSLAATEKFRFNFKYPKDLLDFIWNLNGDFINDEIQLGLSLEATWYREYSLGVGYDLDGLRVGAKFKLLRGIANFSTSKSEVTLFTDPEYYALTFNTDYLVNMSGLNMISLSSDSTDSTRGGESNFDVMGFLFNGYNTGYAIDIGASYDINSRLTVAASIIDLGYIDWVTNVKNLYSNGSFTFDGIEVNAYTQVDTFSMVPFLDSLKSEFEFQKSENTYRTKTTPQVYLSGAYKLDSTTTVTGLAYGFFFDGLNPALAVGINKKFGRVFTPGLSVAYKNRSIANLGLNFTLDLGPFQMYFVGDNFLALIWPETSKNLNYRFGMNWAFGNPNKKKGIPTE